MYKAVIAGASAALGAAFSNIIKSNLVTSEAREIVNLRFNMYKSQFQTYISDSLKEALSGAVGAGLNAWGSSALDQNCNCK